MRKKPGDTAIAVTLPSIDGDELDTTSLQGRRYMLSFFRFASCPFCNLRVQSLVKRFRELGDGFTIVAVFDSSIENLVRHTAKHHAPFPILADEENLYYRLYGVERSVKGLLRGMVTRFPTLARGMLKGFIPFVIKGSLTTMPADFLVDERSVIQTAYYGRDEGDHLSIEEIIEFSRGTP